MNGIWQLFKSKKFNEYITIRCTIFQMALVLVVILAKVSGENVEFIFQETL